MARKYRLMLVYPLAGVALALSGCASMEGSSTTAQPVSSTAAMGSGSSPFMKAGMDPFSVSNCMKFEATPPECERAMKF